MSEGTVRLELLGMVKSPSGDREMTLPVGPGATVLSVLASAGFSEAQARLLTVLVDGRPARFRDGVSPGARFEAFLPIGGG